MRPNAGESRERAGGQKLTEFGRSICLAAPWLRKESVPLVGLPRRPSISNSPAYKNYAPQLVQLPGV